MKQVFLCLLFLCSSSAFAGASEWIDFELKNGHITIPLTIDGVQTYGMLDSGSQVNALNLAFLNANNLHFGKGQ